MKIVPARKLEIVKVVIMNHSKTAPCGHHYIIGSSLGPKENQSSYNDDEDHNNYFFIAPFPIGSMALTKIKL